MQVEYTDLKPISYINHHCLVANEFNGTISASILQSISSDAFQFFSSIYKLPKTVMSFLFLTVVYFLTGNLDWEGEEFTFNAGAGLVISKLEDIDDRNFTVVEQLQAAFERDWFSQYTIPLQANKFLVCNKHQIKPIVLLKPSQLHDGPLPIRKGQHNKGSTLPRNHHKVAGQTPDETRHRNDRLSKLTRQGTASGLVPVMDNYQERGQMKMSRFDQKQVEIKGNADNPMELPGQSAESSGGREIANGFV